MPTVDQVAKAMSESMAVVPGKRICLDFGDEGAIFLDGVANHVGTEAKVADATIRMTFANFMKLADGSLNGTMAFMTGKLKIDGDMGTAMQLQSVTAKMKRP
ncbi:MAG: SCP2 sterol-binding domain-containing protein [Sphingomonas sp.]|nr:SCP2 sterol-binding domain-containing protein [Sphingomonas sp.]